MPSCEVLLPLLLVFRNPIVHSLLSFGIYKPVPDLSLGTPNRPFQILQPPLRVDDPRLSPQQRWDRCLPRRVAAPRCASGRIVSGRDRAGDKPSVN